MSTQKHSPGPWMTPHFAVEGSTCNCVHVVCPAYCGSICEISIDNGIVLLGDGANDCPPIEEAKANARLIASAPDYFAAVEQMLAHEQSGGDGWWKGFEMLKDAHAKSKGETCKAAIGDNF